MVSILIFFSMIASTFCGIALLIGGALFLFLYSSGYSFSVAEYLVGLLVLASIPLAAWIGGAMLDDAILRGTKLKSFSSLLLVASLYLALSSDGIARYFVSTIVSLNNGSYARLAMLLTALAGHVIFCGATIAFVVTILCALCEVPARWVMGGGGAIQGTLPFAAMRVLLSVMVVALSAHLIIAFFVQQLWPTALMG